MNKLNMDCLILIFNQADEGTLYSCLLVNKEWCSVIVPILWKKFSWYGHESRLWKCSNDDSETDRKLYNTILSCLQISSKQLLPDNGVKLSSTIISSSPLFDYISFCKFPTALIINEIIKIVECPAESCNLFEQELYKLFVSRCKCNNIKELDWETSQPLSLFPGASICFSKLDDLYIDTSVIDSNALYEMAQICKDLSSLSINCYQDLTGLISLIDAQRNLKWAEICPADEELELEGTCMELGKALARKSNTIEGLRLDIGSS